MTAYLIKMDGKPFDARFERSSVWDGDVLVFADRIPTPNGEMTIVFRYELQDVDAAFARLNSCALLIASRTTYGVFDRD